MRGRPRGRVAAAAGTDRVVAHLRQLSRPSVALPFAVGAQKLASSLLSLDAAYELDAVRPARVAERRGARADNLGEVDDPSGPRPRPVRLRHVLEPTQLVVLEHEPSPAPVGQVLALLREPAAVLGPVVPRDGRGGGGGCGGGCGGIAGRLIRRGARIQDAEPARVLRALVRGGRGGGGGGARGRSRRLEELLPSRRGAGFARRPT
mmetsp:Transcript_11786/g.53190  ORF Transcript_11786/g.53190 Transcript_11786/m.53190 type:complete len:206 (-) Transcript_11786:263-880(-)